MAGLNYQAGLGNQDPVPPSAVSYDNELGTLAAPTQGQNLSGAGAAKTLGQQGFSVSVMPAPANSDALGGLGGVLAGALLTAANAASYGGTSVLTSVSQSGDKPSDSPPWGYSSGRPAPLPPVPTPVGKDPAWWTGGANRGDQGAAAQAWGAPPRPPVPPGAPSPLPQPTGPSPLLVAGVVVALVLLLG